VSARLTLPAVPPDVVRHGWPLRATDIDVFGHVNNANYWVPVEEWLAGPGADRRITQAEIEFGGGIAPDDACEVGIAATRSETLFWFLVGDETRATARVRFAGP
jgi:acyl-ACP thioesterase